MIRLVLAVPVRIHREALLYTLASNERMLIVAAGWCVEDLLRHTAELAPDVLVLDYSMPDGLAAAAQARRDLGSLQVVAVGVPDSIDDRQACEFAGVAGILPDAGSVAELAATIEAVARAPGRSPAGFAAYPGSSANLARLTRREREIGHLIAGGLSNRAISLQLHIEVSTVKNHVHAILEKLDVSDRGAAAEVLMAPDDVPLTLSRI